MFPNSKVFMAQHTQGEHEEPAGLGLIKYGTTNPAPIKFTVQVSHKYSIYVPYRNAGPPASVKVAGVLP